MNTLEATAPQQITRSLVSDWVGDPADSITSLVESLPNDDKMRSDHHQITDRMFDLLSDVYGHPNGMDVPLSTTVSIFRPLRLLISRLLMPLLQSYIGFSYDSIDVTMSVSDPKAVAGGTHVGWYPARAFKWGADNNRGAPGVQESTAESYFNTNTMSRQHLLLGPTCEALYYGQSSDVKFSIPWQFNTTHLYRDDLFWPDDGEGTTTLLTGEPLLFLSPLPSYNVSTVAFPPILRIFVKFNNLRFLGPNYVEGFVSQMEAAAASVVAGVVAEAGAEVLSSFIPAWEPSADVEWKDGTFESPSAVQLSYAGDTTSMGPPSVTPTFSTFFEAGRKHPISDFLSRPQFVTTIASSNTAVTMVYADPFNPLREAASSSPCTTWFNYFGQHTSYFRGTIVYDLVIMGHPLVEVAYKISLLYPCSKYAFVSSPSFSESGTMEGIAKGVTRIRIPMPWGCRGDYAMCLPDTSYSPDAWVMNVPSAFSFSCRIVSTMLDVTPTIPTALYISAGEDFMFYWPQPPGLYNSETNDLKKKVGKLSKKTRARVPVVSQIGIPVPPSLFETRACAQPPPSEFSHPIKYVEDFFRYWCRALPYAETDNNDEPVPEIKYAAWPAYGFMADSAGWTPDVNNSWYICQDYLSFFSYSFLYFHGSIGMKTVCVPTETVVEPYKYMALSYNHNGSFTAHNPFTSSSLISPQDANFGVGASITPGDKQPILEFTMPYISRLSWMHMNPMFDFSSTSIVTQDFDATPNLTSNVKLFDTDSGDLTDALFRKAGPDFAIAVETLPPSPFLWRVRGGDWS